VLTKLQCLCYSLDKASSSHTLCERPRFHL
jgi:hypothetical protein